MSIMDTLTPQTFTPTGAKKVLVMTKRDDAEDLKRNEEMQKAMDLQRFLKAQTRQQLVDERREAAIRAIKIRRKKDAVRKAKLKWEQAVKALEEALHA